METCEKRYRGFTIEYVEELRILLEQKSCAVVIGEKDVVNAELIHCFGVFFLLLKVGEAHTIWQAYLRGTHGLERVITRIVNKRGSDIIRERNLGETKHAK